MLPGKVLPGAEERTKILIEKCHAEGLRRLFGDFFHQIVLLVGADEEAGGKAVEALRLGHFRGAEEAHLVALDAPPRNILCHRPDEGAKAVVILLDEGHADLLEVVPHGVAPGAVLGEGVDVGVIPEACDVVPLSLQIGQGAVGAGRAADVQ